MTLDEIELQVQRELGDLAQSGALWEDTDIQNWLYEAELEIARKADLLTTISTSTTSTAGTANYNAPTDKLSIRKVEYDGNFITQIEFEELSAIDPAPDSTASASIPSYWYFLNDDIYFYPAPATTGDTIRVTYTNYPTKLTTGASSPTIPVEYHPALVTYCLARGKEMEEETEDAIYFRSKFNEQILEIVGEAQSEHQTAFPAIRILEDEYGW